MSITHTIRTTLVALAALGLAACGINSVPAAEEEAKAKWADVQSAYQRRADLIPNLVSTAEAAAISERDILTNVTEARAKAMGITITTDDLSDPAEFAKFQEGQNQLSQALGSFRTVVEQYPDLKSNQGFADLMVSLEGTENRIDNARTKYNEAVRAYNTTIRTFPDTIGANIIHGAEPMEPFTAQPGSEVAPDVEFNVGNS
ncbi:MAG: LemA family protein [Pseudomonadota bacterium]